MTCHHCGASCSIKTGAIIICTGLLSGAYCSFWCYQQKRVTVTH